MNGGQECRGPSLTFAPLRGTKDGAQDDSLTCWGRGWSLLERRVWSAAARASRPRPHYTRSISSARSAVRRGKLGDDDGLVSCMRAFSNPSQAVECWNSQAGGEVSIRAAAYGRFLQLPAKFFCNLRGFLIKHGDASAPFHRRTVYGSCDFQLAFAIEGLECS